MILNKIEAYVRKWQMLDKKDKVIAGISGGADSICLLFCTSGAEKKRLDLKSSGCM